MQLITTHPATNPAHHPFEGADLTTLDDEAIVDFFAEAGLAIDIIDHCTDVSCPVCFGRRAPRAA